MASPVWQTGSSLENTISPHGDLTVLVDNLVTGEDRISMISAKRPWFSFDGQELEIENAPVLREDTDFKIKFRAWSDDESDEPSDATYTLTVEGSNEIYLQSSLFFKPCINYESGRITPNGSTETILEASDNDYRTFTTETHLDIDISDDGNATTIDFIFIKGKNIDSYDVTISGGSGSGFIDREIPETIKSFEGTDTDTTINDFQHELYVFDSKTTATTVTIEFTGTDVEIYAIMILELGLEIEANSKYVETSFEKTDRAGSLNTSVTGIQRRGQSLGGQRWKWQVEYACVFTEETTDTFLFWMEENLNFVYAVEFSRYPDRVFPALFPALSIRNEYISRVKSSGEIVYFNVSEQ